MVQNFEELGQEPVFSVAMTCSSRNLSMSLEVVKSLP